MVQRFGEYRQRNLDLLGHYLPCVESVMQVGGWQVLKMQPAAGRNDGKSFLGGVSIVAIISWFVVMITQAVTAQGPVQIACGAKDEKQLEKAFLLGGLLIFPIGFLCAVLGLVAKVMFPEIPLKSSFGYA